MAFDFDCDALVIGAGVAGTATAILLAQGGWRAAVVEQHAYPRRKVCGECISAGSLSLLDDLGVGPAFRGAAGPELRRIGWMDASTTVSAAMPPCSSGPYAYGRALGRDRLDALLLQRARALGVLVLQPARVRRISGAPGGMACTVEPSMPASACTLRTPVVIDAHGSWERGPDDGAQPSAAHARGARKPSDLFAFKANFRNARLAAGFLPVLALPGGYGGMVQGDDGRTTLACCVRRDGLAAARAAQSGGAGAAVERLLLRSCAGVRAALEGADREGPWLTVGPLRPGIRVDAFHGAFRVGNAAGESHPLIGEGISTALQGAALLTTILLRQPPAAIAGSRALDVHRCYAAAWHRAFAPRLKVAALYAHIAMRPSLAAPAREILRRWPSLLHRGARLAGKAARASGSPSSNAEIA